MRNKKKLGYPQRILLNQYIDCVGRTKKDIDLSGTWKLVSFMLEESSIVQSEGSMSFQRTADAISLINRKLCPGKWCTRTHCTNYSSHSAWNCRKTRPSICKIYKIYIDRRNEKLKNIEPTHE